MEVLHDAGEKEKEPRLGECFARTAPDSAPERQQVFEVLVRWRQQVSSFGVEKAGGVEGEWLVPQERVVMHRPEGNQHRGVGRNGVACHAGLVEGVVGDENGADAPEPEHLVDEGPGVVHVLLVAYRRLPVTADAPVHLIEQRLLDVRVLRQYVQHEVQVVVAC